MKMNKILLSIVAVSVFAASCNTSLTVQKKQHSNGYYVSLSTTEKNNQKNEGSVATKNATKTSVNNQVAVKQEVVSTQVNTVAAKCEGANKVEAVSASQNAAATQQEVKTAMSKKSAVKEAEKEVKLLKAPVKDSSKSVDDNAILLIILAILLSPIAVGLATNWNTRDLVINILLWVFCFGLGGIIHAFIVLKREGVI
jgi:uncharacterized membrane protein YqaE (UPF0057 family)